MSIYGYLVCKKCKVDFFLGSASHEKYKVFSYQRGKAPNDQQPLLNKVLWKFLAEHTGHEIAVLLEHDLDPLLYDDWIRIGGDRDKDISLQDYLNK